MLTTGRAALRSQFRAEMIFSVDSRVKSELMRTISLKRQADCSEMLVGFKHLLKKRN